MRISRTIINSIIANFALTGVQWKVGGELKYPTEDDIKTVIDRLYQAVYDGEEQTQASTGGILVKKDFGRIDLYLYLGELNDNDD